MLAKFAFAVADALHIAGDQVYVGNRFYAYH